MNLHTNTAGLPEDVIIEVVTVPIRHSQGAAGLVVPSRAVLQVLGDVVPLKGSGIPQTHLLSTFRNGAYDGESVCGGLGKIFHICHTQEGTTAEVSTLQARQDVNIVHPSLLSQ